MLTKKLPKNNKVSPKLMELLMNSNNIQTIPLTGIWKKKFYHIVYVPNNKEYTPFILFEDGKSIEILSDKKAGYSYFMEEGDHISIKTGEPLWFSTDLINSAENHSITLISRQTEIKKEEIYESIKRTLNNYYEFYNPEELNLVFAHIVHTYFLGLLGKTFYLLLEGEKNTGKSSLQGVMAQLQFNGCFTGKTSMASLIRKIHFFGATINIDELDKLHKDEKKAAIGILNSGVYSTGTYEIVNMDSKKSSGQIKIYHTFASKTFSANRALFDDSLLSRCVVINTVRNRRAVKSIYGASEEDLRHFKDLRNTLFAYCLMNGRAIHANIEEMQKELGKSSNHGRRLDIFSIIAGILQHFQVPHKKILEYLQDREPLNSDSQEEGRFYIILDFLIQKISLNTNSSVEFTNSELRDYMIKELETTEDSPYSPTPKSVGSYLKKHRIVETEGERRRVTRGTGRGKYSYRIGVVKILELIERSQFDDLKEKIKTLNYTPK